MKPEDYQSLEEFVEATLTKSEVSELDSLMRSERGSLTEEQSQRLGDLLTKLTVAGLNDVKGWS